MACTEIIVIAEIFQKEPLSRPVQPQQQVRNFSIQMQNENTDIAIIIKRYFFCSRLNNPLLFHLLYSTPVYNI